jgi:hypothetical protein
VPLDVFLEPNFLIHNPVDSTMHSAPAVTYPVGRSRFHGCLLLFICVTVLLLGLIWQHQDNSDGWRLGLYTLTGLSTGVAAVWAWYRTPCLDLRWDGQIWNSTVREVSTSGYLSLHFDLQFCMLLSLRSDDGNRVWLWPERSRDPAHWNALRRAVYSHAPAGPRSDSGAAF